jgi:hypothetical protein
MLRAMAVGIPRFATVGDTTKWSPSASHARHRDRRNQTRNLKRAAGLVENISIDIEELSEVFSAVLIVYRTPGEESLLWQGRQFPKCH